jgi:hypothetical protein
MTNGNVLTNLSKKIALNRTFKGTPDYLSPSQFAVGTGNTTPAVTQTALTTPITIGGANYKDFVASYPLLDETNMQSTMRMIVLTTECNGNSIKEMGIFNKDASPLMWSRAVFNAITKTSSVQIIFVQKDKITF